MHALALGQFGKRTLIVAGTDRGALVVWDFDDGTSVGCQLNAHVGGVDHVCFGTVDREPVLIAAGSDGILTFWTPMLEFIFRIEVGEAVTALTWVQPDRLAVGCELGVLMLCFT